MTRTSISEGTGGRSMAMHPAFSNTGTAIGANGSYVAFTSQARNLRPGDTNYQDDVFVSRTGN